MQNRFLTNPVKVVVVDPLTDTTRRAYVFLGDIPKGILAAVTNYADARDRKHYDALLKEYYGNDFRKKLGLDIADVTTAWMYTH